MNFSCNIIWAFIVLPIYFKSQLIIIQPEKVFESPWVFNPEYIAKNNIKKIHLQILDKKDFHSPEDLNRQMVFEYDKNGQEIFSYTVEPIGTETKSYYTILPKGKRKIPVKVEKKIPVCDTNFRQIFYLEDGRIKCIRTYNKNKPAIASYYNYYSNGFIREIKCKEWPEFASGKNFILQKQEILFTDSFQALWPSEKIKKNIYFNSDHRPYKEQYFEFENNQLKIIRDVFTSAPWIEQYKKFEYDNDNKIIKAIMYANTGLPLEHEYTFDYDENGNLYSIYFRKNKFLEKETGFVYEARSSTLHSIVIRDYMNKSIQIIRVEIIAFKPIFSDKN